MPSIRTNAVNAAAAAAAVAAAAGGTGAGQSSGHSTPSGNASSVGAIAALANNLQNMGMKERPPVAERPDRPERPERLPTSVSSTISVTLTNANSAAAAAAAAAHNDGSNDSNKLNTGNESSSSAVTKGEAPGLPKTNPRFREIAGYVGFANLPNQVYRKAVKRGFEFTLMVVGAAGLGKSTLINSMFLTDIYDAEKYPGPSHRLKKTVTVDATKVLLKENGVNLTLTVVDTPGFGDSVDNSNCWVPILEFVDNKYEDYLTAESRVKRTPFPDNRVHCCLYFIAPTGHGLRPLDIACMQCLSDKVNIIPVIAKADTMTPDEVQLFKKQILNEIAQNKIKIYDFPKTLEESEDDDKEGKANVNSSNKLRSHIPFAVVGANTIIEVDGKKLRGRRYPWGIVEVENLQHCDFIALRNMVIRTHLQDLKEVTNDVHYENFRCKKLSGLGLVDGKARLNNKNPLTQMEEEKREHELKMKKMEAEMEQVFDMKVREKQQKLKDSEMELARRHEERKKALDVQVKELEEQWLAFEKEKREWEELHHVTLEELKRRSLGAHNSSDTIDSKKEKKKKGLF